MAAPGWPRPSRGSIRGCCISAAGCTRCQISWRRSGVAIRRGQGGRAGDLSRRQPPPGRSRVSCLSPPLTSALWFDGAATGTRSAGVAGVLQFSTASLEEAAPPHYRALLRRGAPADPAHGVLCERQESVDRIIYSIFQRFNLEWKTRTLRIFTRIMKGHPSEICSEYQTELYRKERPQWIQ